MSSLLEILSGACRTDTAAPVIVSESHDTSAINWVNGMPDPGEMIKCGYLPQLRRREGEQDAEYAARIRVEIDALPADERERIMSAGVQSAIARAALDTSTGRVAVMTAGQPPWHRLGVNVSAAVTSAEASRLASLNWTVSKRPLSYSHHGFAREQSEVYAIVRDDTGAMLGSVGSRYAPIQNDEGFALAV